METPLHDCPRLGGNVALSKIIAVAVLQPGNAIPSKPDIT
jgi:hypothetical protein